MYLRIKKQTAIGIKLAYIIFLSYIRIIIFFTILLNKVNNMLKLTYLRTPDNHESVTDSHFFEERMLPIKIWIIA